MAFILLLLKIFLVINTVKSSLPADWALDLETSNPAFDPKLYEDALDPELCRVQLNHIRQNTILRLQFLDAGIRLPRGMTELNFLDLGNYDQCLGIEQDIGSSVIEGKYCRIQGPLINNFNKLADVMNWSEFDENILNDENLDKINKIRSLQSKIQEISGVGHISRSTPILPVTPEFALAVCVPKACTIQEGIRGLLLNLTFIEFQYEEQFCRFKDDKPWVPVDYVAIVIFSFIGLLTIISTSYDIWQIFILKKESKSINAVYRSFSLYTNTKRLTTFSSNPNNLSCVDGIRAISMFWIVVGHTYVLLPPMMNNLYVSVWLYSLRSQWIIAAPNSVDTFFFLTGMLLVYTTVGKMSRKSLLKNLHLFYLNRALRLFPILAAIVLLQASIFHRIADGPNWSLVAANVNACRTYWWSTLLYIQNLVNVTDLCIGHSWYLAIDMHCYIVSPVVLYWLLSGKRKQAWIALTCILLISLTAAATYCFILKFQGIKEKFIESCIGHSWYLAIDMHCYIVSPVVLYWLLSGKRKQAWIALTCILLISLTAAATYCFILKFQGWVIGNIREGGDPFYHFNYYFFTVPRAPPFFVGMIFGYLLSIWKGQTPNISRAVSLLLWILSGGTMLTLAYIPHLIMDPEWELWIVDDLVNSFARSLWAICIGWIIFACQYGYGGPVNWFLSLDIWKIPSRISFALYLFHFQFQYMINGMSRVLIVFSDFVALYEFFAQLTIAYGISFALTVIIDSPFAVLVKKLMGEGTMSQ